MKLLAIIVLVLCSSRAQADSFFECMRKSQSLPTVDIRLSEESKIEVRREEICNGGVGDPMICNPVVNVFEHRELSLSFRELPKSTAVRIDSSRRMLDQQDPNDFSRFRGQTVLNTGDVVSASLERSDLRQDLVLLLSFNRSGDSQILHCQRKY